MNTLLAPLWEISEFEEIQKQLDKENGCVALTGCIESQKLHMAYGLSEGRFQNRIFVTYSDQRIKELLEDERFYDREAVVYPSRDLIFYQADIHGNQLTKERIKTLRRILEGKPATVITTFSSLMAPQLSLDIWKQYLLHMDGKSIIDEKAIALRLVEMGYEKTYQVETPGQFSVCAAVSLTFSPLTGGGAVPDRAVGRRGRIRSVPLTQMSQRSIEQVDEVSDISGDGDGCLRRSRFRMEPRRSRRKPQEIREQKLRDAMTDGRGVPDGFTHVSRGLRGASRWASGNACEPGTAISGLFLCKETVSFSKAIFQRMMLTILPG